MIRTLILITAVAGRRGERERENAVTSSRLASLRVYVCVCVSDKALATEREAERERRFKCFLFLQLMTSSFPHTLTQRATPDGQE